MAKTNYTFEKRQKEIAKKKKKEEKRLRKMGKGTEEDQVELNPLVEDKNTSIDNSEQSHRLRKLGLSSAPNPFDLPYQLMAESSPCHAMFSGSLFGRFGAVS